jgi:hypothetical protein
MLTRDVNLIAFCQQSGDLNLHLSLAKQDIGTQIKPGFDGVAVFDMETWRPRFEHNFDSLQQYQQVSLAIAKARYPHLNKTALRDEAAKEFNEGAE